ncbi:hypothetical protein C8Q73DRAFT_372088 [Cubamyces lactineus]|nr:hypothetical protein C8Q73DRAFT_372088 [Cubamyces lactineus]
MSPRKFTSDTSDTDTEVSFSSSILHDPDYWFNDGNIVVLAKDYQPSARLTGFRVYMGVLSRHSRVFKDLLSPPKVGEDEEIVDGCRSIRVANSCFDFKHLLRALYDGIGFHMHACKFAECAAFVRLGYEYDITAVYKAGLETLRTFLDQRENWASDARCKQGERGFMGLVDMISAANLFRTIGTSKLRAIALYLCTDYVGTDFLVSGAERVDGFQEQLAKDDLIRCLEGRTSLISRRLNYMNDTTAWATDPQLKCYNEGWDPDSCLAFPGETNCVHGVNALSGSASENS